ncbi:uncharacterized protein [Triticum aestivum]|uniref:uncharacterized protein n=1 Tax=Triticum aestivum TaxID=4565 RepID=UPI001D010169|nr:uncharacterized protein LOC123191701 [Triticum aestivum]
MSSSKNPIEISIQSAVLSFLLSTLRRWLRPFHRAPAAAVPRAGGWSRSPGGWTARRSALAPELLCPRLAPPCTAPAATRHPLSPATTSSDRHTSTRATPRPQPRRAAVLRNPSLLLDLASPCEQTASLPAATVLELTGADRTGLISEVFAVLADMSCNVVDARAWSHCGRLSCLVYLRDEDVSAAGVERIEARLAPSSTETRKPAAAQWLPSPTAPSRTPTGASTSSCIPAATRSLRSQLPRCLSRAGPSAGTRCSTAIPQSSLVQWLRKIQESKSCARGGRIRKKHGDATLAVDQMRTCT